MMKKLALPAIFVGTLAVSSLNERFGLGLTDDEERDLVEYLKSL